MKPIPVVINIFAPSLTLPSEITPTHNSNDIEDPMSIINPDSSSCTSLNSSATLNCTSRFQSTSYALLCSSLSSSGSFTKSWPMQLTTHAVPEVTVLLIDIKSFTDQCAAALAGSVGEWVATFYERVNAAAAAHGVSKAEVRGDCCVCVAGTEVLWRRPPPTGRRTRRLGCLPLPSPSTGT